MGACKGRAGRPIVHAQHAQHARTARTARTCSRRRRCGRRRGGSGPRPGAASPGIELRWKGGVRRRTKCVCVCASPMTHSRSIVRNAVCAFPSLDRKATIEGGHATHRVLLGDALLHVKDGLLGVGGVVLGVQLHVQLAWAWVVVGRGGGKGGAGAEARGHAWVHACACVCACVCMHVTTTTHRNGSVAQSRLLWGRIACMCICRHITTTTAHDTTRHGTARQRTKVELAEHGEARVVVLQAAQLLKHVLCVFVFCCGVV